MVPYDLSHLERSKTTFIRQRTFFAALGSSSKTSLRYTIHFRWAELWFSVCYPLPNARLSLGVLYVVGDTSDDLWKCKNQPDTEIFKNIFTAFPMLMWLTYAEKQWKLSFGIFRVRSAFEWDGSNSNQFFQTTTITCTARCFIHFLYFFTKDYRSIFIRDFLDRKWQCSTKRPFSHITGRMVFMVHPPATW